MPPVPPPPPGGPPYSADADGRVSIATAQRIVQEEVNRATAREGKVRGIVALQVQKAQKRGSRRVALLTVGVVVAIGAVVAAAGLAYRSQKSAHSLATEVGLGKKPVAAPVGDLPEAIVTGRQIYEQNRTALYVMGYTLGNRIGGCCTAFAVGPDTLATNAHCVIACGKQGGTPIVTQNDSGGKVRFTILSMKAHPAYSPDSKGADSPDVGLLRIQGKMPRTVTIANDAELRALGPGDDLYVLGFPGRVMDPISPSATFLSGRIGRVMGFKEDATTPDKSVLIQHDAVTRGGNSGSPVFNQYGHVIGVHTAHIDEEHDVAIGGQKTTVVDSSPFRIAMRIDLLRGVPAP